MRVFAALTLPPAAVGALSTAVDPMRMSFPGLRWVATSAWHLTVHFFGELDDKAVSSLGRVFEDPRLKRPAFSTRFGSLGQFPQRGNPRVLWVSLADDGGHIRSWWDLFESTIAPLGWKPDERGFTPHVTLARNSGSSIPSDWGSRARIPEIGFPLSECVLFQSILGRAGAHYVPLRRISFSGGAG